VKTDSQAYALTYAQTDACITTSVLPPAAGPIDRRRQHGDQLNSLDSYVWSTVPEAFE